MENTEKKNDETVAKKSVAKKTSSKKTVAKKPTVKKVAAKAEVKPATSTSPKKASVVIKPEVKRVEKDTSDVNPEFTDAFIREVDEDVKNDNFKELWNRYGLMVIAIVVLAVCGAVSFEKIKGWQIERNRVQTEAYMDASRRQADPEAMIAELQKISQESKGIYADFAKLQIANVLFEQQKDEDALTMLNTIANDETVANEVRNIALVKYATYKVDTASTVEMNELLKPVLDANNSWTPLANDMLAMVAIREGDLQTARDIYASLLKVKDLPAGFKSKVQEMLSSLDEVK